MRLHSVIRQPPIRKVLLRGVITRKQGMTGRTAVLMPLPGVPEQPHREPVQRPGARIQKLQVRSLRHGANSQWPVVICLLRLVILNPADKEQHHGAVINKAMAGLLKEARPAPQHRRHLGLERQPTPRDLLRGASKQRPALTVQTAVIMPQPGAILHRQPVPILQPGAKAHRQPL